MGGRGIPGRNAWQPVKGDAPVQSKRAMERRAATRHHPTRTLTKPRRDLTTHGELACVGNQSWRLQLAHVNFGRFHCFFFGVIVRRKRHGRLAGEMGSENQPIGLVPCHCPLPGDRSATAAMGSSLSSGQKWELIEGARN